MSRYTINKYIMLVMLYLIKSIFFTYRSRVCYMVFPHFGTLLDQFYFQFGFVGGIHLHILCYIHKVYLANLWNLKQKQMKYICVPN